MMAGLKFNHADSGRAPGRARKIDGNQRSAAAILLDVGVGNKLRRRGHAVADALLLYVTIDHEVIFAWAQRRGARPSTFEGDEHPWPLLFSFGAAGVDVRDISWDRFFAEFERADLAFIYRDAGPNGEVDDFHEFVKRATVQKLVASGKSTIVEQAL